MPRKNNRKTEPHTHGPSIYDRRYRAKCYGCAFAGQGFVCQTSDGNCLKTAPRSPGGNGGDSCATASGAARAVNNGQCRG